MNTQPLRPCSKHLRHFPIPLEELSVIIETALLARQVNQIEFSIRVFFDANTRGVWCALREPDGTAKERAL
jgi:hypothetical protein